MKVVLVVLAVIGICEAAYGETYYWVDSHGGTHYTHVIENVPRQYRRQVERAVTDPVTRALLEKEHKRAVAIREEALKKARERVRREEEEARRKRIAEEKQRKESAVPGASAKREVP